MKTAVPEHPSKSKSPTEFSKLKKLKITIMKSMKNFAAQQLSKKEMNNVKGGDGGFDNCGTLYHCTWNGGESYACSKQRHELETLRESGADCRAI
jgi:bacteriocin-like protein